MGNINSENRIQLENEPVHFDIVEKDDLGYYEMVQGPTGVEVKARVKLDHFGEGEDEKGTFRLIERDGHHIKLYKN